MKTEIKIKGNGEEVIITLTGYSRGGLMRGRIFTVKPGLYDVLTAGGVCERVSKAQIADISVL